eukprot:7279837-Prymnesium_polylepis.1
MRATAGAGGQRDINFGAEHAGSTAGVLPVLLFGAGTPAAVVAASESPCSGVLRGNAKRHSIPSQPQMTIRWGAVAGS